MPASKHEDASTRTLYYYMRADLPASEFNLFFCSVRFSCLHSAPCMFCFGLGFSSKLVSHLGTHVGGARVGAFFFVVENLLTG